MSKSESKRLYITLNPNKEKDSIILNYLKSTYSETRTIKSILYQYITNRCNNQFIDANIIKHIENKEVKYDTKDSKSVTNSYKNEIQINEETLRYFD